MKKIMLLSLLLTPLALMAQPAAPVPPVAAVPPVAPHGSMKPLPPMGRQRTMAPGGRWWLDPATAERIGLTEDQRAKLAEIYHANRLRLIDVNASLQKEQLIMEPMMEADRPDQAQVLAQIDKIAQARAELEKANARMLFGFRGVLSQEQWKKLQQPGPRPKARTL